MRLTKAIAGSALIGSFVFVLSMSMGALKFYSSPLTVMAFWALMVPTWLVAYWFVPAVLLCFSSLRGRAHAALYLVIPVMWLLILVIIADAGAIQEGRLTWPESLYYNFFLRLLPALAFGWFFWKALGKSQTGRDEEPAA